MDVYVPKILYNSGRLAYGEMLVELQRCEKCKNFMINKPYRQHRKTFPYYFKLDFEAQVEAAGWKISSGVKVDNEYICEECAEEGKADFECFLCKTRHSTKLIKKSFGDPTEFLCKNCYETVSAKKWDSVVAELDAAHKYDYD